MSDQAGLYRLTGLSSDDLAEVLAKNPRAYMAVKGAVAEKHLENYLIESQRLAKIAGFRRANGDFDKDFYVTSNAGEEKIVECKNVQVIPVSSKQDIRDYIAFCIDNKYLTREEVQSYLDGISPSRGSQSVGERLASLDGRTLKDLLKSIPQDIRESGLPRYHFSSAKLSKVDILETTRYLAQFDPPLTIDFQRTRNSTDDTGDTKVQRFYKVGELHVVAACLFSRSLEWNFIFCNSTSLKLHDKYTDRYTNALIIDPNKWKSDIVSVI
jgi:hypothetical protein